MSSRPLAQGLALAVLIAAANGCGADDGSAVQRIAQSDDAIKGGYEDTADTAVVGVLHFSQSAFGMCSGTLIAPNLVLTARHCVSDILNDQDGGVYCPVTTAGKLYPADTMYVTTRAAFEQDASAYRASAEVIGLPVDTDIFCGHDQALLVLAEPIPATEAVPYTPRVDTPIVAGEEYYAVGFGATGDSGAGSGERRRRDGLFIECVAEECPTQQVKETEWVGDTGICSGDSGGPAIDLQNRVIGVTSRGSQGCDNPVYGYVYGWGQWIKDTAVYAAGIGGYPPPAWATGSPTDPVFNNPVGGECTVPADCPSNVCLYQSDELHFCTRPCNESAPCPDGYTCDLAQGLCTQNAPPPVDEPGDATSGGSDAGDDGGGNGADGGGGCSVPIVRPGEDPTKPIPWKSRHGGTAVVLAALAALALRRRRASR
jgi:MYXO-CTERM domain-containing protein